MLIRVRSQVSENFSKAMTTKLNLGGRRSLINCNGSIFLPTTSVARGGNQWLAWRLLVVDHRPFVLDSAVFGGPAGPATNLERRFAMKCFEHGGLSC